MRISEIDIAKHYYYVKPFIPRRLQILVRRWFAERKRQLCRDIWPIDREAGNIHKDWQGWPDNKRFALVLTHDVDTYNGHEKCFQLMHLEEKLGFRSSFNFVADGYCVSDELRRQLVENGFEVGVHGLVHNRDLFSSEETFKKHAVKINEYMEKWQSVGFRSPCMYHNLEWFHGLHIKYDASTFDTDPFEPQSDGMGTIFPFYVNDSSNGKGYVELPYTLPQDFTLFVLFGEKSIDVWRRKLDWIIEHGGMALVNTHPDYMKFCSKNSSIDEYPSEYYEDFLGLVRSEYEGQYWHVLPKDIARFWHKNYSSTPKFKRDGQIQAGRYGQGTVET